MKKLFIFIFLAVNVTVASAQKSITDILMDMPDEIVPYLNAAHRAELARIATAKDTLKIKNMLNGETMTDSVSSTYMRIRLNTSADMQIKLLPLNDTVHIICTVKTLHKPVADSNISFYSTDWKPINSSFGLPVKADEKAMISMLTARPDTMSESRYSALCDMIEPVIAYAEFMGTDNTLKYSLSMPMLNKEEKSEINAIIKQKYFKWNGEKFNND